MNFHWKGGMGAWLGTGYIAIDRREYTSYDDALKLCISWIKEPKGVGYIRQKWYPR